MRCAGADTVESIAVGTEIIAAVRVQRTPAIHVMLPALHAARGMQLRLSTSDTGSAFRSTLSAWETIRSRAGYGVGDCCTAGPPWEGSMVLHIRRREFIVALRSAAFGRPLAARAQQPSLPKIGVLCSKSPSEEARLLARFREGLNEIGYVEGHNVAIEYRWAENQNDRLPALAADLLRGQVAVIATPVATLRRSPPKLQPPRYPSSSQQAEIRSR